MTEFTREGITAMLQQAKDVPMLDMFGDENWTPNLDHPALFKRAGIEPLGDLPVGPRGDGAGGFDGNFVEASKISFDETLCGSPFGGPC